MLGHRTLTVEDYWAMLRRRMWLIIVPVVVLPVLAYGYSLTLPERYTSTTLVLVEGQRVPQDYVRATVTDALNQRLGTMREQILSRSRLQPIIEKFNLYPDASNVPMEDQIGWLRAAVNVTPLRVTTARAGELSGFTVDVTLSEARTAQQVCQEITSMFMAENLKLRATRATDTTAFLQGQLDEAKKKLDEQGERLAAFKQRHIGKLPGQEQTNMNLLMGTVTRLEAVTQSLNRSAQNKAYLESILSQQMAAWDAAKSGTNPDNMEQQLVRMKSDLVTLEGRYTSEHPDVRKLAGEIAQLEKRIEEVKRGEPNPAGSSDRTSLTEPPQIVQLRTQIHNEDVNIRERTREQSRLQRELGVFQARVQLSPVVEQEFTELTRDHETAQAFYNELLGKRTESEMAKDLEMRQQGEQFTIMDPANLPEKPTFPNRLQFAGGGLAAGLALGLGLMLLLEFKDKSLRSESDVEVLLDLPTLALIPELVSAVTSKARHDRRPHPQQAAARMGA